MLGLQRAHLSTVHIGRLYEQQVRDALCSLAFKLTTCGGAGDRGIDLRGCWSLPSGALPVVLQCKALSKPLPPAFVREFEGALGSQAAGTLGILVCSAGFSARSKECFGSSRQPLALARIVNEQLIYFEMNCPAQIMLPHVVVGRAWTPSPPGPHTMPMLFHHDARSGRLLPLCPTTLATAPPVAPPPQMPALPLTTPQAC